jgi:glycosyltransferase involved in cell wall biosynthesis
MMRLLINGLAASAGGGLTYLRNVIPQFAARTDAEIVVALPRSLRRELGDLPRVSFLEILPAENPAARFWQEQTVLPSLIRQARVDVLVSAGNFALRKSPVPQLLLSRNALYTNADFYRDLRWRHEYTMWLDTRVRSILARRSIFWADCTAAPSAAFAQELCRWTGRNVVAIHHGFDHEVFFQDPTPLPPEVCQKLEPEGDALRLLLVSHYNYYRNFETLLRAIPLLREQLGSRKIKLFLTCSLKTKENPGSYRAENAAELIARLGITENVVELGTVPYGLLHHVYRACDVYVAPAYAESFAHPLVEAMASGLPVVASDLPVHREICDDAALYFPRFAPRKLAATIALLASSRDLAASLWTSGLQRSRAFSWSQHVDQITSLARNLAGEGNLKAA